MTTCIRPLLCLLSVLHLASAAEGEDPRLTKARDDFAKEMDGANAVFEKSSEKAKSKLLKAFEQAAAAADKKKNAELAQALRDEAKELEDRSLFPGPAKPTAFTELVGMIGPSTVGADKKEEPANRLAKSGYVVIYMSAHWCGPCRAFTPELVKQYPALKAAGVEVVFATRDRSEEDMFGYMNEAKMPWRAVPWATAATVVGKYGGKGIPNVVVLNPDGTVMTKSYNGEEYQGPQKPIDDLKAKLKIK